MTNSEDIKEQIRKATETLSSIEQALPPFQQLTNQPIPIATVRFQLTRIVIWAFVIYLMCVGAYIVFNGETDRVSILIDMLKTFFLPIVMLMVGHYFGSKTE